MTCPMLKKIYEWYLFIHFKVEAKDERLETVTHQVESMKSQILQKERQLTEIQDKFLQSSVHIMEETVG